MNYKKYGGMYAYNRSRSYEWSIGYCQERTYTHMMLMNCRSITRHYSLFLQCIEEGVEDITHHMGGRVNEILDAKYHLHLHELVANYER